MNILLLSTFFGVSIFLWLKTNTIIEYYNLFKIKGFKILDDYNNFNSGGYICSFIEYLLNHYKNRNSFFISLITCYKCLSVWCGVFTLPIVGINFIFIIFLTIIIYSILNILDIYNSQK